ncbi:unnamed protein product [Adineta ricciae]|uniref:NADH:flavin oxidoreductase/NADH oxidase N-terminal domain-containing protein n=1 Tax=Adineta ricciae TaxID=249248 RepID=A0A814DE17_ADIRI|nr:unnamed protein product [Adineta ricciae]CAF0955811.1 unnamed protein product [Adineta ricciae]
MKLSKQAIAKNSVLPWPYTAKTPSVGTLPQMNNDSLPALFRPLHIRSLVLKNRIVVSPMCTYSSENGFLNDWHLVHLGQFAIGGAALVIQEATAVQPNGRITPYDAGLWMDEQMEMTERIVQFIHSQNCAAGIQLAHAGRKASTKAPFHQQPGNRTEPVYVTNKDGGWSDNVVGPSALPFAETYCIPKEISLEEIDQFKQNFVKSVERAKKCGFDFLEIHAAHGYLLSEFLSPSSNKRTDDYGGSFENRIRLLLELTSLVRQAWPSTRPLSIRLSCEEWIGEDGWTITDTLRLIPQLVELGVDIIDTSSGGNSSCQQLPVPLEPGYQVPFSEAIKKSNYGARIMTAPVGLITQAKQANDIIERGHGDLVLIAREFLRDPHFPLRAARELGVNEMSWPPQYQRARQ